MSIVFHDLHSFFSLWGKGWGTSCVIGVAASGHEISTRPFQLVTGEQCVVEYYFHGVFSLFVYVSFLFSVRPHLERNGVWR